VVEIVVVPFHAAGRSRIIGGYWIGDIQAEMAVLCYALDVWKGLVWLGVWAVKEGVRSEKKSPPDASDKHERFGAESACYRLHLSWVGHPGLLRAAVGILLETNLGTTHRALRQHVASVVSGILGTSAGVGRLTATRSDLHQFCRK
jgi:hypothetical protein